MRLHSHASTSIVSECTSRETRKPRDFYLPMNELAYTAGDHMRARELWTRPASNIESGVRTLCPDLCNSGGCKSDAYGGILSTRRRVRTARKSPGKPIRRTTITTARDVALQRGTVSWVSEIGKTPTYAVAAPVLIAYSMSMFIKVLDALEDRKSQSPSSPTEGVDDLNIPGILPASP